MEGAPNDNLFVSGLPVEFDTEAIQQFFSACGNVTSVKSLGNGTAMVRFSSVEEAQMVRDNMTGQQPMGCPTPMTIKFARSGGMPAQDPNRILAPTPGGHKTMLCKWFMNGNQCTNGDSCKFAHGEEDMREQGSWSGAKGGGKSNLKSVQCKFYLQGTCQKGEECSFAHDDDPVESFAKGCLETLLQKIVGGGKGGGDDWGPAKGKGKVKNGCGAAPAMQANGDWVCPECGDIQFARNPACRNCGSPKEGWARATPYGKGGGKGILKTSDLIDGLIAEGLPGGNHGRDVNSLYIANLPFDTKDEDLYTIFASFGAIPPRGVRVMPGTPGRRLYGFVNFIEETNAEFAMMAMNGVTQPDGYKLQVKLKTPSPGKGGGKAVSAVPAGGMMMGGGGGDAAGIDPKMLQSLRAKLATGTANSAYDISQWYIVEHLGHVTGEEEMKSICDMLLAACSHLGLS